MISEDRSMDTPQISRSGRVLKKSAKVKEMEDFDINELDVQGKPRKKSKLMDDFEEYDDKRVAPIKIPKISLNVQGGMKKKMEMSSSVGRLSFQTAMKSKQDMRRSFSQDSSDASKESDSSSVSSESSSSTPTSSDVSDDDEKFSPAVRVQKKYNIAPRYQPLPIHQEKLVVDQQYVSYDASSDATSDDSEDATSDSALVIAEDSDESIYNRRSQKSSARRRNARKDPTYAPKPGTSQRKRVTKATPAARKKKPPPKPKSLSAYMLWCNENRKKIAASSGSVGSSTIGKKLGETWQALSEKEKMAWRRKAKRLSMKNAGNLITTGPAGGSPNKSMSRSPIHDEPMKTYADSCGILGTAPIDAAAHLKLLGDSLTVIGQRLIEHEGQLAVSGIYSVLLDTLLCAVSPLLCLTQEVPGLDNVPPEVFRKTLDHIAYFMPGL